MSTWWKVVVILVGDAESRHDIEFKEVSGRYVLYVPHNFKAAILLEKINRHLPMAKYSIN